MLDQLKEKGWYLSQEGLRICKEGLDKVSVSAIVRKALDTDLRDIGESFLSDEIYKGKVEFISGPCVLQIQKIKNVSVPKYETSNSGPALFRLHATDGLTTISCLQWGHWKSLNLDTPPGTKILIKNNKVPVQNGFLLLSESHFTILGGHVPAMVEKWELTKRLASHVRRGDSLDDGPPPWIPFGKPINYKDSKESASDFKSLEHEVKEQKEDVLFKQQRQANIAEVSKAKEGKVKIFGGGREKFSNNKSIDNHHEKPHRNNQGSYKKGQVPVEASQVHSSNPVSHKQDYKQSRTEEENHRSQSHKPDNFKRGDRFKKSDTRSKLEEPKKSFSNNNDLSGHVDKKQVQNCNSEKNDYDRTNCGKFSSDDVMNNMMSQMKIHENSNRVEKNNMLPNMQHLKPGMEVLARYWEDKRFYHAVVHAVGENGTCVVHFVEYGNYEEVRLSDICPVSCNWNTSPNVMHANPVNSHHSQASSERSNFTGVLEFRRGGNKPFVHRALNENHNQDQQREQSQRQDRRPSANLYQVPHYRQIQ